MSITLYQSKTDPFRHGQTVHIFANESSTCPFKAMVCYCNLLGKRNSNGLVFKAGKFDPLTQKKLNDTLRYLLQQGRINYASHSFRIGTATTAVAAGIPAWLIKTLGRWNSNAYLAYIRCPSTILSAVPHVFSGVDTTHQPPWDPDSC